MVPDPAACFAEMQHILRQFSALNDLFGKLHHTFYPSEHVDFELVLNLISLYT